MSRRDPETVLICAHIKRETEKAYGMICTMPGHDTNELHWIPKSQSTWHQEESALEMPEWLAKKNGFIT